MTAFFEKQFSGIPIAIGLLLSLFALSSSAQKISFSVSAPAVVTKGERFRVTYTLNAKGKNFEYGEMKGLSILGGPSLSTSSNVQIINGKVSQSITNSYVFLVQAAQEGEFVIPSAKVEVEGQVYTSESASLKVVAGQSGSSSGAGATDQEETTAEVSGKELFARVEVNKKQVYQGEPIVATLKIYTRVDLAGFEDIKFPDFTGFWSEEIPTSENISLEREVVNGEAYNVGVLRRMVLFPQASVPLTIEPMELDCVVRQRVKRRRRSNDPFSMFDDFFGNSSVRNALVKVKSPEVKINITSLPYDNRPTAFNGAVGEFQLSGSIDAKETKANEPINLKITLSGKGNMKLIDPLKVDFPTDFEVYDPKTIENLQSSAAGMTGSKTFEYLVIPRHHGNYTLPEVSFSYFNPKSKQYETKTVGPFEVKVNRGEAVSATATTPGVVRKESVASIGSDIRFLKSGVVLTSPQNYFFGSTPFYLAYLLPTFAFVGLLFVVRQKRKELENLGATKNKRAAKMAKKRLKTAESFMTSSEKGKFYKEVTQAIWGYLADKLTLQRSELTKDKAREILLLQGVSDTTADQLFALLAECEFAQFAPSSVEGGRSKVYETALRLIMETDQQVGTANLVKN